MANVELNLIFNASDVFRALDELEARLSKIQGREFAINISTNVEAVNQQLVSLSKTIDNLRAKGKFDINFSNFASSIRYIQRSLERVLPQTLLGRIKAISNEIKSLSSSMVASLGKNTLLRRVYDISQEMAKEEYLMSIRQPTSEFDISGDLYRIGAELGKVLPQTLLGRIKAISNEIESLSSSMVASLGKNTLLRRVYDISQEMAKEEYLMSIRQPTSEFDISSDLYRIGAELGKVLPKTTLGIMSETQRKLEALISKMQPPEAAPKGITLAQVGSLYMLSNVFDRFASRLSSIFDSAFNAFQQSATALQKTRIVSGAPTAEYDKFVSELRKLAPQVMIPFPDLAEIAYSFATRGYANLATAPDVLRPLAISSLITGETLDTMARSILSLMQSWNPRSLQSLENLAPMLVRQFSDLMSYAFAKSPLEVRWFKDIANYAAPLFAQLGYSPAETMAFFMSMAQQIPTPGIGARSARMLLFNVQDIEKSFKIYEKYGIDAAGIFREVSENGGTLADAFKALYDALQSLPKEQLVSVYKQLGGGVRGGMAAMMLGQGELLENISTYIDKLTRESIGYTSIVAAQYRTTPVGIFESAQANLTAKLSELGESVAIAKAALLEFQASLIDVVNKLPKGIVAFGYGAAQGAQFSSRYIIDTIANIGLASYVTKMLGGGALSSLITGGLISAAILPLVAGGYTAYRYVQAKQVSTEARAVQEAIVGESPVEAAARILRTLKTGLEVAPIAPYVSIPILKRVYEFETLEGIQKVYNKEAFTPILSILEEYGNVLEDSVIRFSGRLGSGSSAFRKQASELEVAAKSFFSDLYKTFSFNETQLANVSGWEKIFRKMGLENADVLTSNVATIIERLKESGKGILSEKGVAAGLQQIIAAGLIEKATGAEGFTEFVASLYNIDLSMQDIEALISTIAQSIPEISQKVSEIASQQTTRQEPSYASLLDLWLKGAIMEPSLITELPALKAGDWPVERTWVSGNYADTVAIGWKVLTPEAITTSANLDAAIKPSLIFQ